MALDPFHREGAALASLRGHRLGWDLPSWLVRLLLAPPSVGLQKRLSTIVVFLTTLLLIKGFISQQKQRGTGSSLLHSLLLYTSSPRSNWPK